MGVQVVYADPPWSFDDKGSRIAPDNEECGDGYPTMSTDDICALSVAKFAEPNAALFLWGTHAHILNGDVTRVARAWGFEPKVQIPWAKLSDSPGESTAEWVGLSTLEWVYSHGLKIQIGAGHYVRACTEMLVFCARGSFTVPAKLRVPGFIAAPRPGGHSSKPLCVYDLIEHLYPRMNYLELFARRAKPRGNWRFVGNQAREEAK